MSNYVELYIMIKRLVNGGDEIADFGINDNTGELWVTMESGKTFGFFPNK
jgi:hypothetical protein